MVPKKIVEDISDKKRLILKVSDICTTGFTYKTPEIYKDPKVDKFLNSLSIKDMAEIVVGVGWYSGKSAINVPGSVGNTTSKFFDKGLVNAVLCDGPAGIRIQKVSAIQKNGSVKPITLSMGVLELIPKFVKKFMVGNLKKDTLIYRFTTSFPVEVALAQTWNIELLYEVGKAISTEMTEYGITYWLAPALNIHRNPLCGRNFEYFSEDPYLSGKFAAAITLGIQESGGNYATIKHFACNNQEDNRRKVSSNVDERVLREIYLKGFQIAVEEGHAKSVMTSYNLLNGTYTVNHYQRIETNCCILQHLFWNYIYNLVVHGDTQLTKK